MIPVYVTTQNTVVLLWLTLSATDVHDVHGDAGRRGEGGSINSKSNHATERLQLLKQEC